MAKSTKPVVTQRQQDVYRLLLAGAEFAEIRQYASEKDWQVGDRQIRRYLDVAYRRLAKLTERDRQQLLGRHLGQRRALYARAVKEGDLRTALQILRDEAELEGLYGPATQVVASFTGVRVVERIIDSREELESLQEKTISTPSLPHLVGGLSPSHSPWPAGNSASPTSISANGLIISGTGTDPGGKTEGWIVSLAVPEPSSVVLAAIGAAFVVFAFGRSRK